MEAAAIPTEPENDQGADVTQLALFEGKRVTDHRLNFGGNIQITDPELIQALTLDEDVELVVRGRIVSRKHHAKRGSENDSAGVISSAALYVEGVELNAA